MDGDDADFCNPALYEDERGYMAAMMTAFTNMLGVVRKIDGWMALSSSNTTVGRWKA